MLIFNTTYLVSDKAHGPWLKWIREQHIPFMLDSSYFSNPQVARVITSDKEDGTSDELCWIVTLVIKETADGWKIIHRHNTRSKK